jgi:hypothetical protein
MTFRINKPIKTPPPSSRGYEHLRISCMSAEDKPDYDLDAKPAPEVFQKPRR